MRDKLDNIMGITLHFNYKSAQKAGVSIKEVKEDRYICPTECSCNAGEDYCSQPATLQSVRVGYEIKTPTGIVGHSFISSAFDCKNINQELKEWFLVNVKKSYLSY